MPCLDLQYKTTQELHKIFDKVLPSHPEFKRRTYKLGGEKLELYHRNSLEVVSELFGRPDFVTALVFAPEMHFKVKMKADGPVKMRAYSDMHTGKWWWGMQVHRITFSIWHDLMHNVEVTGGCQARCNHHSPDTLL